MIVSPCGAARPFDAAEILLDGLFTGDTFFDILEFPPFLFLDLCADDGARPGCPFGVGESILASPLRSSGPPNGAPA